MDINQIVFNIIGGTSLLLYGMRIASDGLQQAAGTRLRHWLSTLTSKRWMGVLVGAVVTAFLQSSSATTVMLVGFVSAGFMSLEQTIGVILGADIGTTITVQLLAFNITQYSLLLVAVGVPLIIATRQKQYNYFGQVLLGFGFIFLAIKLIGDSTAPLKHEPLVQQALLGLANNSLMTLLLAMILTVVIHSSAGTIGLAITFATQDLIPLSLALPIIFGANVGTSATALFSSLGAPQEARRVAVAHALFKVVGVLIFFPFMEPLAALVRQTAPDVARQIANAHTLFNFAITAIIFPLARPFAWLIRQIVPETLEKEEIFAPRYLDERVLDTPALAIGQATREALRMADVVQTMVRDSAVVLDSNDEEVLEDIIRRDDQVDTLETAIKRFLTNLAEHNLSPELTRQEMGLIYMTSDLEHIGDIISKSLMLLARKKAEGKLSFSQDGRKEIAELFEKVNENYTLAVAAFTAQNIELAQKVLRHKTRINQIERELRQAHIARLHAGLPESIETSSIHLDTLNDLKRINSHATNIAYVVLGEL
ncbi:MAG: Na/Pi cotransporter family protein [Chloroflexi bacterium]|nr:Na/Pi cotransporter family protein [Chloroflexota bacterium]MBI3733475.1 Na/Pi cotransporter family protein [Chloroflexota bacterium]